MKNLKSIIALFVFAAGGAFAQSAPAFSFQQGFQPITQRYCQTTQNVGSIYTVIGVAGGVQSYLCQQTGAASLGQGAFAWQPIQITSSSGGGTLVVASGKTATISNTLTFAGTDSTTLTTPSISGGLPIVIACGATTTGTANCADTATTNAQIYYGKATLASNAQVITISPGYTSTSTYYCVGNDVTTRANPVQVVPTSATTFTITNTTGASDVIQYVCVGT